MYEPNGWSRDPREARHQAYAAGATYLDMIDALARIPGASDVRERDYQFKRAKTLKYLRSIHSEHSGI